MFANRSISRIVSVLFNAFMILFLLIVSALRVTPAYAALTFTNKTTAHGLGSNTVWGVFASGSTIYAATSNGLSISTDGGSTFTNKTTANGLGQNFVQGVFESGSTIYAATTGGLSISSDGGNTFTNKTTANGLGHNVMVKVFVIGSTVYAATRGGVSISSDGGNTFTNKTTVNGLGDNIVLGVFVSGSTVYAATEGGLSISTDGGSTFTNKTTVNGLGSNVVRGVFANGSTVYAGTDGGLSISTDGGSTFINKTSANGLGHNMVRGVFAIGSTVYAATAIGLSITTDGGNTFTNKTTANGLGSNNLLGVFASGSMVYATTDGGLSIGFDDVATATPTVTPTASATPTATLTPTPSLTPTMMIDEDTVTPTLTVTATDTPTRTNTPTFTPTPTATNACTPFTWARRLGGTSADEGTSITVDGSGNTYTAGYFLGTVDFDPGAGTFNLTSAGSEDVFFSKLDASGNFVWARRLGGIGNDRGTSITVDGSGDIYTTGYFLGTVDFDPGAGMFNLTSAGSNSDIFVSKLDSSGNFVWARRLGGTSADLGKSIVVDGSGNVYTTGQFSGTADFDPSAGTFNLTSAGSADVFVSQLDTSGNFVWARQLGGTSGEEGSSIVVDGSGDIYTTGFFQGTADFDPGAGTFNLTSAGVSFDVFVSKLDTSGNFVWAMQLGGISVDLGNSITVDGSGDVYTTGYFSGTVDFDPGAGTFNLTSAGNGDVFVSKLDSSGNFVWARQLGGTIFDQGFGIVVDGLGDVYTTGFFQGTVDFDPGAGTFNLTSAGSFEAFVSKLDGSGNFVWAMQLGGTSVDQGNSIAVDGLGNVYTTGYLAGTADFDPGAGTFNLTSAGNIDVFVSKLSQGCAPTATATPTENTPTSTFTPTETPTNTPTPTFTPTETPTNTPTFTPTPTATNACTLAPAFTWARKWGGTGLDQGLGIYVDGSGNTYTTGYFQGTVDFDPGAGTFNLTSAGSDDVFVSKLDASGNFVWARQLGGTDSDQGRSITVDGLGNVYTTGSFRGTADFDPGGGTFNLTTAGGVGHPDVFVSKLDTSGNFVWARGWGTTSVDQGASIVVDGLGNVYTTGNFGGTVDFDPGAGTFNLTGAGFSQDVFVSKLDSSGNFVWAREWGGTSTDGGEGIFLDGSGNVYTTGYFQGTADFDPGAGTFNLTSAGSDDAFVSKLDASGNFVWARQLGGTSSDGGFSIFVDGSGNVYTSGYFFGTADFDPGAGMFNLTSNAGSLDIFVSKLDGSGNFVWAVGLGGTGTDFGRSIVVDGSGNVYTTGFFAGTVDFDPGGGTFNLTSAGSNDAFISKLDSSGNFAWAVRLGGTNDNQGSSITLDGSGDIYTTGLFQGTADFDPGAGTFNLTSAGNFDVFVSKLSQGCAPTATATPTETPTNTPTSTFTPTETPTNTPTNTSTPTHTPTPTPSTRYVAPFPAGADTGDCSIDPCATITYAISQAVAGNTIEIAAGTYTEAGITVDKDLTITGAGATTTIVQAAASPGAATNGVFLVNNGVTTIIEGITIQNGHSTGGGIRNSGTLTLNDSIVSNNLGRNGGGIHNIGTLVLNYSTVANNMTDHPFLGGDGGGIYNSGTITLNNSAVNSNFARHGGGGIFIDFGSQLILNNSIIANNTTGSSVNDGSGGGINAKGTVTLNNSTVSGNSATDYGGGISASDTMTLNNSVVSNNIATSSGGGGMGGGIFFSSTNTLTLNNTTVSGNLARFIGGGISVGFGTVNLNYSTVTNNTSNNDNLGAYGGGGILYAGTVNFKSSIVAGNKKGTNNISDPTADCLFNTGGALVSQDYNLTGSGTGCGLSGSNDVTIDPASVFTDVLGALADNGGATQTHALIVSLSNPALNAIPNGTNDCGIAPFNFDQRSEARPFHTNCDMGAYEAQSAFIPTETPTNTPTPTLTLTPTPTETETPTPTPTFTFTPTLTTTPTITATIGPPQTGPTFVVNTMADTDDGSCDLFNQGIGNKDCTLREAINAANSMSGTNAIVFVGNYTITLISQLPVITSVVEITGNGATNTTIQANAISNIATYRLMQVGTSGNLTLNDLAVRNGRCNGSCAVYGYNAGGILNLGALTVANSSISGNISTFGGGIANTSSGTLTIIDSTLLGNSATYGGGVINEGLMTITNSTFSVNSAPGNGGGGVYNQFGTLTIVNSTFSGNSALSSGGGVVNSGGTLTIANSTFSGNSATFGGGVYNSGTLTITNSTFSGNSATSLGGGVINADTLNLYNSIVANSTSGGDCYNNSGIVTDNNNLIEGTGSNACGLTNGTNGNIVGLDPDLGTLTGSPAYYPLNSSSLAVDAGDDVICEGAPVNNTSQNGVTRPQGAHCDIGAYEAQSLVPTPTTTPSNTPTSNPTIAPTSTETATLTPTNTATSTPTYTATVTSTVTNTPTNTFTPTVTSTPDLTPLLLTPVNAEQLLNNQPTFDWTDVSGALSYTIQISNNISFTGSPTSNTVTDSTYTQSTSLPNNVTRYWRVQATTDAGAGPWSLIRSFVTAKPPSAPGLASPGNNALVTDYTPLLDWNNSTVPAGTTFLKYELQIATDSAFTSPTSVDVSAPVTNSEFTPGTDLNSNTTYYWQVRAYNTQGQYSSWSAVRNFRTALLPPTLLIPNNAMQLLNNRPAFDWADVTGVTGYRIQIANNAGFSPRLTNTTVTPSTYTPAADLTAGVTLYWRVQSNGTNGPSAWSVVRTLTTANPPTVPTLASPANNAATPDYTPLLDWNDSTLPVGTTLLKYELQLATDSLFTSPVSADATSSDYTPSADLNPITTYYWRVRAYNTLGQYSAWSAVRSFGTALLPSTLITPADASSTINPRPVFDWSDVTGGTGYRIQIANNIGFAPTVTNIVVTPSTYTPTADLPTGVTLYWRVQSNGTNGPSNWSVVGALTVISPPSAPTLASPANNALTTDYTPLLDWNDLTLPVGTTLLKYELQLATDNIFTSPVSVDVTASDYTPSTDLNSNMTYYWRVRAYNTLGQIGAWSTVRSFRTALLPPLLVTPADASLTINRRPVFDWSDVTSATGYRIQIANNIGFSPTVTNTVVTPSTYTPTADLPANTTLYWRVQSNGTNGPSAWSVVQTITTANPPGIPNLVSPANNAVTSNLTPLLDWSNSSVPVGTTFLKYELQISTDAGFTSPASIDVSAPATNSNYIPVTPLNSSTTYYWRVRSYNTLGQYSSWSAVRIFTTP